jgi:hypothetical protein
LSEKVDYASLPKGFDIIDSQTSETVDYNLVVVGRKLEEGDI